MDLVFFAEALRQNFSCLPRVIEASHLLSPNPAELQGLRTCSQQSPFLFMHRSILQYQQVTLDVFFRICLASPHGHSSILNFCLAYPMLRFSENLVPRNANSYPVVVGVLELSSSPDSSLPSSIIIVIIVIIIISNSEAKAFGD